MRFVKGVCRVIISFLEECYVTTYTRSIAVLWMFNKTFIKLFEGRFIDIRRLIVICVEEFSGQHLDFDWKRFKNRLMTNLPQAINQSNPVRKVSFVRRAVQELGFLRQLRQLKSAYISYWIASPTIECLSEWTASTNHPFDLHSVRNIHRDLHCKQAPNICDAKLKYWQIFVPLGQGIDNCPTFHIINFDDDQHQLYTVRSWT